MAPKISILLPVYNEEKLLRESLRVPIQYVHEVIIMDGGPNGHSIDRTKEIIDAYDALYPGKIIYESGTWRLEDGSWDESTQRNGALSKVTGNFLMPHCGDMIYTESDFLKVLNAIEKFPNRKIFYCPFIEFWLDTQHIRLYHGHTAEAWFPVPAISDVGCVSMDIVKGWKDGPHLQLSEYQHNDFVYVTGALRYHYGWISGFEKQVMKHVRNITQKQWGEIGEKILIGGTAVVYQWAISHVLSYPKEPCCFDYVGDHPFPSTMSYLDGKDEFMQRIEYEGLSDSSSRPRDPK